MTVDTIFDRLKPTTCAFLAKDWFHDYLDTGGQVYLELADSCLRQLNDLIGYEDGCELLRKAETAFSFTKENEEWMITRFVEICKEPPQDKTSPENPFGI